MYTLRLHEYDFLKTCHGNYCSTKIYAFSKANKTAMPKQFVQTFFSVVFKDTNIF